MKKVMCEVYKGSAKDETYLYVAQKDGLKRVPEELIEQFGTLERVMPLLLREGKQLARVSSDRVLEQIEENGFYLQLPPPKETYMLDLFCKIDKE